jgi:hypothetical protein
MTPAVILALADLALGMLEKLAPAIANLAKNGEVSAEEQQALDERVVALRPGGTAFGGPEWEAPPE